MAPTPVPIEVKKELEPFRAGTFQPVAFVDALTHRHLSQSVQNQNERSTFDPLPFIKAFEASTSELQKLRKVALRKVGDLEDAEQAQRSTNAGRAVQLGSNFETITGDFRSLETRISKVGSTAVHIGEQLETIDQQRMRALEAKDLVLFFQEFNTGNTSRLDLLKNSGGWDGRAKAAKIVRRLSSIAKEIDLAIVDKARMAIQKYAESIETEMLNEFDQAYKDGNTATMATCAKILMDFNGGQSCIQAYVNQHEFFTSRMKLYEMESSMMTRGAASASASATAAAVKLSGSSINRLQSEFEMEAAPLDRMLDRLFNDVRATVEREWSLISSVFPNAMIVMQLFIQRIFAQSIQTYVEGVMAPLGDDSLIKHLRTIHAIHAASLQLEADLKAFARKTITDQAALTTFTSTLERCREDLFVPYIDGDKYIDREVRSLQQAYQHLLQPFTEFQTARKLRAKNQGMFNKLGTATLAAAFGETSPGSGEGSQAMTLETAISVQLVSRMVRVQKEAMQRCKELSGASEVASNANTLFLLFSEQVVKRYVDVCLEYALEDILAMEPKTEPELRFFNIIHACNSVVHNIQLHFQSTVTPLISTQPTVHRETVLHKNGVFTALELKVNMIVQKEVAAIVGWLGVILGRQRRNDYRPKDIDLAAMTVATSPSGQCCDFLNKVHNSLSNSLDGKNLVAVMSETCVLFHGLLLEHIKKFIINVNGGLLLAKDLARIQDTVRRFKLPSVDDRFETLRQFSNIYVVLAENLKPLLDEGLFARLDPRLLHSFIVKRADYKQAKLAQLFHGLGALAEEEEGGGGAGDEMTIANVWEKGLGNAVEAMGDAVDDLATDFATVGEGLKRMLQFPPFPV